MELEDIIKILLSEDINKILDMFEQFLFLFQSKIKTLWLFMWEDYPFFTSIAILFLLRYIYLSSFMVFVFNFFIIIFVRSFLFYFLYFGFFLTILYYIWFFIVMFL